MSSNHSLYKSDKKWKEASELERTASSLQRKINLLENINKKKTILLKARKLQSIMVGRLLNKLNDERIIPKEYAKPYLIKKRDAEQLILEFNSGDNDIGLVELADRTIKQNINKPELFFNNRKV